ncbi:hypothetical protein AMTRI_Chr08g206110 [Amborella trichopoda]
MFFVFSSRKRENGLNVVVFCRHFLIIICSSFLSHCKGRCGEPQWRYLHRQVWTRRERRRIDFQVKEKDTLWFIKFCVPWCKYCKKLGSLWDDLGVAVEGEDGIEIGEVDCSTSKLLCTKVNIHAYPTFKLFYEGDEIAKYTGEMEEINNLKAVFLEELIQNVFKI